MERESTIAEIASTCAIIGILVLMVLLMLGLNRTMNGLEDRLDRIQEALASPRIARTSVVHGFYQDQQDPKNSGLRMIRVARDGTMVVLPLMPPQPSKEEPNASPK